MHDPQAINNAIRTELLYTPADELVEQIEKFILRTLMEHNNQNQSQTARDLKIYRNTLRAKLRKYGLMSAKSLRVIDREGE